MYSIRLARSTAQVGPMELSPWSQHTGGIGKTTEEGDVICMSDFIMSLEICPEHL